MAWWLRDARAGGPPRGLRKGNILSLHARDWLPIPGSWQPTSQPYPRQGHSFLQKVSAPSNSDRLCFQPSTQIPETVWLSWP